METVITTVAGVLTMASYMVGFLLPRIIKMLTKDLEGDDEKVVVTYLICFVAAMIIDYKSLNSGDLINIGMWFAFISTQAHLSFKLFYSPIWKKDEVSQ